jgi:hypothetical protein
VSKTAKSAPGGKADVDDEEDSDDESVTPPIYLCQIVVLVIDIVPYIGRRASNESPVQMRTSPLPAHR